jgi:hypothetical protein
MINKLKPEIKTKWLDALRSGKYTQGTGRLVCIDFEPYLDSEKETRH